MVESNYDIVDPSGTLINEVKPTLEEYISEVLEEPKEWEQKLQYLEKKFENISMDLSYLEAIEKAVDRDNIKDPSILPRLRQYRERTLKIHEDARIEIIKLKYKIKIRNFKQNRKNIT